MGWLFATFYDRVSRATEEAGVAQWRRELLAATSGDVVELGAGTGLNLPAYPTEGVRLVLTEPSPHMRKRLQQRADDLGLRVKLLDASAEHLPLEDGSMDYVVCTLVLCSVTDPNACLKEAARVLRPGGALVYLEHVAWNEPKRLRWQRWIEPFWRWFSDGCRLTRRTGELIRHCGFRVETEQEANLPKAPSWVRRSIRGVARKL